MNCEQVEKYLGTLSINAATLMRLEITQHLLSCPDCRSLWSYLTGRQNKEDLPADLREKLIGVVLKDLKPVSSVSGAGTLVLGFLIVFTLLVLSALGVTGAQGASTLHYREYFGVLAVIGIGAVALAIVLSREMVPGEQGVITPSKTAVVVMISLGLAFSVLFPWQVEQEFEAMGWQCAKRGLYFVAPATGLILLILRRGAVLSPDTVGALTGLFGGLVGVGVLHFSCMIHNAPHLLIWHAGLPLACAGAGYLAGHYLSIVWPTANRSRDGGGQEQAGFAG